MQFTETEELDRTIRLVSSEFVPIWGDSDDRPIPVAIADPIVSELYRGSPDARRASYLDTTVSLMSVPPLPAPRKKATDRRRPKPTSPAVTAAAGAGPAAPTPTSEAESAKPQQQSSSSTSSMAPAGESLPTTISAGVAFVATKPGKRVFSKAPATPGTFPRHSANAPSVDEVGSGLIATSMRRGRGGPTRTLSLKVYLPNRELMRVQVPGHATVQDAILAILRQHAQEKLKPSLRAGSNCYELRLHEEDGYPDEDFPALDRKRKIKNFGQGGSHEYCLCELAGVQVSASTRKLQRMESLQRVSIVKVLMPEGCPVPYAVIRLNPDITVAAAIRTLARNRRHRLGIYHHEYALQLSPVDQKRLKRSSPLLANRDVIEALEVQELQLIKRKFADAPAATITHKPEPAGAEDEEKTSENSGAMRFGHNLLSAAAYEEWPVIKVNKRGRRQNRIMGIDLTKICNKKVNKRRLLAAETAQRPERVISDILQLRLPDSGGKVFFITYRESAYEQITTEYEAQTSADRAAIVAKLEYILNLNHVGDRVKRPQAKRDGAR